MPNSAYDAFIEDCLQERASSIGLSAPLRPRSGVAAACQCRVTFSVIYMDMQILMQRLIPLHMAGPNIPGAS
jgi:hypothetical protein